MKKFRYLDYCLGVMEVDSIDELIISALTSDARQDISEIVDFLRGHNHKLSNFEVESRIDKLIRNRVITNYTISVDPKKIPSRVIRTTLMTFKISQSLPKRIESLKKYLNDAPFVIFSGSTKGGLDWITVRAFPSEELADQETDIYRNLFGDIIQTYQVYDFVPTKSISLHALSYTKKEHESFLKEWMPPFL